MKKRTTYLLLAAALTVIAAACAKQESTSTYESSQTYFEAWLKVNYPGVDRILGTATKGEAIPGVAILEDQPGSGAPITDSTIIFVKYTQRNLVGDIEETTEENLHKQLGSYSYSSFYGPQPWYLANEVLSVGLERALLGNKGKNVSTAVEPMRIGGKRKFIVPCWLTNTNRFSTEEEYLSNKAKVNDEVYEVEIVDATSDIERWQLDSMKRYSALHLGGIDTLSAGFFYKQLKAPDDDDKFRNDTTVYINYIGRLLNGNVFDTNIKDTAKVYHLYSASKSYKPSEVNWSEETDDIKLGDSSVIPGFAKAISLMKSHEKCLVMFSSSLGYGVNGSGSSIPPYSPLIFEIELVEEEN